MYDKPSRRGFIQRAVLGGSAVVSMGVAGAVTGCSGSALVEGSFDHGVASGDPLSDRVILWSRVTPKHENDCEIRVFWEVSIDPNFSSLAHAGSALISAATDFTIKVDALNLLPNKTYYYRFSTVNSRSRVGTTKTLPVGSVDKVRFIALSCSNYSAGYFHVYADVAQQAEVDVALHLGDYIYEHARGEYASEDAEALGRLVQPSGELISLSDYRTRYAQYRSDKNLQEFHASLPVIAVWDDHEIANNAWMLGAENHNESTEGSFMDRLASALKAYSEWMPIRPKVEADVSSLYRNFEFGDLVNLIMLDTRIVGKDEQLELPHYIDSSGAFDIAAYEEDVNNPERSMLGQAQLGWLRDQISAPAKWSLLGQQVLMGEMKLPGAIATRQISVSQFAQLASIAHKAATDIDSLTDEQRVLLQDKGHLLELPQLPYNLDAWDGYPTERRAILEYAQSEGAKLVVLAGDTHNAWANNLRVNKEVVGVEFATASVTSPGIEAFFGLETIEQVTATEVGVLQLIKDSMYTNLADRGYLTVTFTADKVTADWKFVTSIKEAQYQLQTERAYSIGVALDNIEIV